MGWAYRQDLYAGLSSISQNVEVTGELCRINLLAGRAQGSAFEEQHKIQPCLSNRTARTQEQGMEIVRLGSTSKQPLVVFQPPANVPELPW